MRPLKQLPTATDTPAEPIAVGIMATAIGLITVMAEYGYRPYGYYGYGWRPGITIGIGRGWGWRY